MKREKTGCAGPPGARSFTVVVTGTRFFEWQGYVRAADGAEQPFSSAQELLRLLDRQIRLSDEKEEEQAT